MLWFVLRKRGWLVDIIQVENQHFRLSSILAGWSYQSYKSGFRSILGTYWLSLQSSEQTPQIQKLAPCYWYSGEVCTLSYRSMTKMNLFSWALREGNLGTLSGRNQTWSKPCFLESTLNRTNWTFIESIRLGWGIWRL